MPSVEQELRRFVLDNFVFDDRFELSDTDSFLDLGIVDSMGILQLVGFVEERYGIEIKEGELIPENLDSIDNLARLLRAKLDFSAGTRPAPVAEI
jgi:acyl carrier protein